MRATAASISSSPHKQTGMPATTRGAGRPATSAARVRVGTTWDLMARSSAIHRMVPSVRSPHSCQHARAECGEQDRGRGDVGDVERVVHAERLVLHIDGSGAGERPVEDVEVGAHRRDGALVGQPEHLVDDPVVRDAETEGQTTLADGLDRQDLLGQCDRVAGLHRNDSGADLDTGRRRADHGGGGRARRIRRGSAGSRRWRGRPLPPNGHRPGAVRPWSGSGPAPDRSSIRCAWPGPFRPRRSRI